MNTCKHETTSILGYHGNASLEVCDWGCGAVLVSVTDDNGISHVFTPDELLALHERLANNHAAMSIYQRDIAALRERVAALEAVQNAAQDVLESMYGSNGEPFPIDLIPDDRRELMDKLLVASGNVFELEARAKAEGAEFTETANRLLETKADLWRKMADEGGE